MVDAEAIARGLQIRREVMGEAFVQRAMSHVDDFSAPLQELVNAHAWGTVWARPGLERKTRSLINLAMLAALNRMQEFKGHVRGALNNGCTVEEIREVLLQVTVYAGMPAGVEAFRNAKEVLEQYAHEQAESQ